jgi:protein-disulfide isomerase
MNGNEWAATLTLPVSPTRDHVLGPPDAPYEVVEYGDYQCPFCRAANEQVAAVTARMRDQVRYAYRHFPLSTIHPFAQLAAEAAESAGAQGKYWDMHDLLFENQDRLGLAAIFMLAEEIGLDSDAFRDALENRRYAPKVREDFMSGARSGVAGTPTFFVNGVRHDAGYDAPSLIRALIGASPQPHTAR